MSDCPHCTAGKPSVFDGELFHWAHPSEKPGKLIFCHSPWRDRCRRCSANVAYPGAKFCGVACSEMAEAKL